MSWSSLGSQFALELAFGVLLGLCFMPKAPVGVFFYRLMGAAAAVPLVLAIALEVTSGGRWLDPVVLAASCAVLGSTLLAGRAARRLAALLFSCAACGLALVATVSRAPEVHGAAQLALASLSAMATGAVAGGVGLAMVLGHWYLTVPQLPVSLLVRANRQTVVAMVSSAVLVVATCLLWSERFAAARRPLFGPWGLFQLSARVVMGILLPLLFAWMAASALRYQNTRSATGILYASTVMVLIGAAVSISLQDSYGVPL